MCNSIYFSTTCPDDLTGQYGTYRLRRPGPKEITLIGDVLKHPHQWSLESGVGGCSCHFSVMIGLDGYEHYEFGVPQEWMPDDPEHVAATADFYDRIKGILSAGYEVDLVTMWSEELDDELIYEVNLNQVTREEFRFFDYATFRFSL